jgi:hypothetical protein
MTSDLERIESIVRVAFGKTIGNELAFTFPEVLEVIKRCTMNEIAVLGVEVFEVRPTGYLTKNLSVYDQQIGNGPKQQADWIDYVKANNILAEEFVKLHPTGDDHVYVLTTTSWREFLMMKGK